MDSVIWFLIVGALFFFMMRHGCGGHSGGHGGHGGGDGCGGGHGEERSHEGHEVGSEEAGMKVDSATVIDPVCGMEIAPNQAFSMIRKGGRQNYFCSEACAAKFNEDPGRYS